MSPAAGRAPRPPGLVLPPEQGFYRIHWADRGAWWFSSDGSGRFDLERPRGTCYVAQDALGAFAEVGTRLTYLDPEELARRSLACLRVPRPLYVADVISPLAADVGVGARCRTGVDYPRDSHPWAQRFAEAGFDGIRYGVTWDRGPTLSGLAIFGWAGAQPDFGTVEDGPIPEDLVTEAMARFGFAYAP